MAYYFCEFSPRILFLKHKCNKVYLFSNRLRSAPLFLRALRRVPFIRTKLSNLTQEPDVNLGDYKGLYYRLNKEALECTEFVYHKLKLHDNQFLKIYNEKFKTDKIKPFVLKWLSIYVFELLSCLYRIHLDTTTAKILYLSNTPLNCHTYEWWHQKTGNAIQIKWLKESEAKAGLETIAFLVASFVNRLLSRGLCLPVKPRKFKILFEAVWGLKNSVFRDDFIVDNKIILKRDLLFYTTGVKHAPRLLAFREVQDSGYECINIRKMKMPLNLLFGRLFRYHFLLPLFLILNNFRNKQNYLLTEWLPLFHAEAVNYEILLSHYQVRLELSTKETSLNHMPETIILNYYGARNVLFHWSDMTSFDAVTEHFKLFNTYLIWGKAHYHKDQHFIDNVAEIGCWLKNNFNEFTGNKKNIYEKLGLDIKDHKILVFYDESFAPDIHFTEDTLLDFWQMMSELIDEREDIIGILKPKSIEYNMPGNARREFNEIRERCLRSERFYFIDRPREISAMEIIAISDINITMGMCSPSTLALLCGKIGLYYDTTGNDQHPFMKHYKNVVAFDSRRDLFLAVNRILEEGHNPLNEIDQGLLEDYDHLRDDRGLQRFREALLKNL